MISVNGLGKAFPGHGTVLHDISFRLEAGEFGVLYGPSGSGKSTILRCIAGLEKPDAGEIVVGERVVFSRRAAVDLPPQSRGVGMVFQSYAIWPHLTVLDNVVTPLTSGRQRLTRTAAAERARQVLERVGMAAYATRAAPLLSGGQQQRVALARALASSSGILLMDEPLSNLDARLRESVRQEIKTVVRELGTTVLYVTHDRAEALGLGDQVIVMDQGRALQTGTPLAIYTAPVNVQVAEQLGPVNWFPGRCVGDGVVECALGRLRTQAHRLTPGDGVRLGVRREAMSATSHAGEATRENQVPATVVSAEYVGGSWTVRLRVGDAVIDGTYSGRVPVRPTDAVTVGMQADDVMVFTSDGSRLLSGG